LSEAPVLDRPVETAASAAAPTGPLADLILVRLLPTSKSRPSPKKLRDDLAPFFQHPPTAPQVTDTLNGLRAAGLMKPLGQHLTDTGRERAMKYLGVSELPAKANFGTIKAKFLVPKALGLSAKAVDNSDKLAAVLLKRKLGLPVGSGDTVNAVLDAIACRELGFSDKAKLNFRDALVSKHIGEAKPLSTKDLKTAIPARLLEPQGKGTEGLRKLALKGFADSAGEPTPAPRATQPPTDETFDLELFANTVRSEARKCPTGRFGDNKVFISHVWRQLQDEPRFKRLGFDGFKAKLVDANRARYLDLLPADLNQAFSNDDIEQAATVHLHSTYHFIATGDGQ
jgi:hypothetical protein